MSDSKKTHNIIPNDNTQKIIMETGQSDIKNLIYVIRNQQVMIDSDLAMLYQVETKRLNEAVKRNISRFPDHFRFQLTKEEYNYLKSQFATSNSTYVYSGQGGRRKLPYVFTEQGIAMLSAVLKSDIAVHVSIKIMDTFIEMRKYMSNTALLYERLNAVETRQTNYQAKTDERFDKVFEYISAHKESDQKIFFNGQIFDAFSLITRIIQKADKDIILIDGYVDITTLNLLSKKKEHVAVTIYTLRGTKLTDIDVKNFNAQYPSLVVKNTCIFHDRFMFLDQATAYHIGASLKDAGKKCFGINLIQDTTIIQDILKRLTSKSDVANP